MADLWVKFHAAMTKGSKRALPRATRFIFLELCLQARDLEGSVEIRSDLDLPAAVYDIIGGNLTEIGEAVSALVSAGMVAIETIDGERFLTIPSWERWNRPDTSTDRVKRHRDRKRGETHRNVSPVSERNDVNALEERRGEERREEENETRGRAPVPVPPVVAEEAPPSGPSDLDRVVAELNRVSLLHGRSDVQTRAKRLVQMAESQANGRRPVAPYVAQAVDRLASKLLDEPDMKASQALSWVIAAAEGAWRAKKLDRPPLPDDDDPDGLARSYAEDWARARAEAAQ